MSAVGTEVGSVLDQLELRQPKMVLTVDGYQLPVTNLDKVLWPGGGRSKPLTKRDLLRYLARHTQCPIGIVLGLPLFQELFNEKWCTDLEGGLHWLREVKRLHPR